MSDVRVKGGEGNIVNSTGGGLNVNNRFLTASDVVTTVAQLNTPASAQPALATTMDWPTVYVGQMNRKLLVFAVTVAFSGYSSGQATIQLYASTVQVNASTGAGGASPLIGFPVNLGAIGATVPAAVYYFSPTTNPAMAELQWPYLYLGVRVVLPSSGVNAGSAAHNIFGTNT